MAANFPGQGLAPAAAAQLLAQGLDPQGIAPTAAVQFPLPGVIPEASAQQPVPGVAPGIAPTDSAQPLSQSYALANVAQFQTPGNQAPVQVQRVAPTVIARPHAIFSQLYSDKAKDPFNHSYERLMTRFSAN
jgi:hypothetical protein